MQRGVVPRVDRHTHLEGALDPAWVRRTANARGRALPESLEALWRGEARPFEAFIEAFLFSAKLLDSKEAIRQGVEAVARRTSEAGGAGFDLWCSPFLLVSHLQQLSLEDFWRGLEAGLEDAAAQGLRAAVIVDAVNHFGPAHGHAVLDMISSDLPSFVKGFSTGGLEQVPFRDWAPVFDRARSLGLSIAAHAGETAGSLQVREAVLEGGASRIVHGVRASEAAWELLAERGIPVDICPTSNALLIPDIAPHPLPRMLALGVRCALGTDDPGIFPCTLLTEARAAKDMGLTDADLSAMRAFGAEDAWCLTR